MFSNLLNLFFFLKKNLKYIFSIDILIFVDMFRNIRFVLYNVKYYDKY